MSIFEMVKSKLSREELKQVDSFTPEEKAEVETLAKKEPKTAQSFIEWLRGVNDISRNVFLSKQDKRLRLCEALDMLPESVYVEYFPQIVRIVQQSKENCQPYKNTQEQVDNILSWLPRFKDHRELLALYIQQRRAKYGLEV